MLHIDQPNLPSQGLSEKLAVAFRTASSSATRESSSPFCIVLRSLHFISLHSSTRLKSTPYRCLMNISMASVKSIWLIMNELTEWTELFNKYLYDHPSILRRQSHSQYTSFKNTLATYDMRVSSRKPIAKPNSIVCRWSTHWWREIFTHDSFATP